MSGAPSGNKNAAKAKMWSDVLRKVAIRIDKGIEIEPQTMLEKAATALWTKAVEGDVPALKEIGDRLEGKAVQSIDANIKGDLKIGVITDFRK